MLRSIICIALLAVALAGSVKFANGESKVEMNSIDQVPIVESKIINHIVKSDHLIGGPDGPKNPNANEFKVNEDLNSEIQKPIFPIAGGPEDPDHLGVQIQDDLINQQNDNYEDNRSNEETDQSKEDSDSESDSNSESDESDLEKDSDNRKHHHHRKHHRHHHRHHHRNHHRHHHHPHDEKNVEDIAIQDIVIAGGSNDPDHLGFQVQNDDDDEDNKSNEENSQVEEDSSLVWFKLNSPGSENGPIKKCMMHAYMRYKASIVLRSIIHFFFITAFILSIGFILIIVSKMIKRRRELVAGRNSSSNFDSDAKHKYALLVQEEEETK